MMASGLLGEKNLVLGDRGCHRKSGTIDTFAKEGDLTVLTPAKKPAGGKLSEEQKSGNRLLSAIWAVVEHPFRVLKRQFGYVTVRYSGLARKPRQIVMLFALNNTKLARKWFLPSMYEMRP